MIYAKYTIVLKTLLDDADSKELIDKALSTYPLIIPKNPFNHSIIPTREEINKKLLNHYKYREIGFETFGRFLDELEITMNEIMPKYNQLFNSEDIINGLEDIFGNLDVTETFDEETSGTSSNEGETSNNTSITGSEDTQYEEQSTGDSKTTSEGSDSSTTSNTMNSSDKHIKADTPQSELDITAENMNDVSYASEVDWNKGSSSSEGSSSGNTSSESNSEHDDSKQGSTSVDKTETSTSSGTSSNTGTTSGTTKHTLTRKGNQGVNTYAHDMLEFRQLFLNIVEMIIEDPKVQELFMGVY